MINRNESVLKSDLPLKEELKKVLGADDKIRTAKVWDQYSIAKNKGLPIWEGKEGFDPSQDSFYKKMLHMANESFWEKKFEKIS